MTSHTRGLARLALACSLVASTARAETPSVRYTVSLAEASRNAGFADVQVEIDRAPATLLLRFLPWLPGAYELRSFGREVRGLSATSAGTPLRVRRESVDEFSLEGHAASSTIRVRYRIAASLLSDDGADLNAEHAYFNPGAILPRIASLSDQVHALTILDLPRDWQVYSALGGGASTWSATSYEQLCDAPVEATATNRLTTLHRDIAGVRFDLIVDEEGASAPQLPPKLLDDLTRIVEAERALAGPLPFSRYLVLIHLSDRSGRNVALEHASSASLVLSASDLGSREGYAALLHMLAHEVFHAWNARRLIPRESPSQLLQTSAAMWITEGLTEHAAVVAQRRAGVLSASAEDQALSEALTRARLAESAELSLSDLSLLAGAPPTSLATDPDGYYAVGHAVSLALVAELLVRSKGRVGLEQLLAALLPAATDAPRTIDVAELARVAESLVPATTPPLSSLLESWVSAPFSLQRLLPSLQRAGLGVRIEASRGADTRAIVDGEPPLLRTLPPGGAWQRAGTRAGDRVLSVAGSPATPASVSQLATGHATVARPLVVEVERAGARLHLTLLPRARPAIVVVDTVRGPSAIRQRLLGGD